MSRTYPHPLQVLFALWLFAALPVRAAEPATDAALQGTWVVTAAEQRGQPFDAIKGGTLKIEGETFELVTATGNRLTGKLRIAADLNPKQLDFLHDSGATWAAIYALSGPVLRLNYVDSGDGTPRPTVFATAAETAGTVIVLRRPAP